MILNADSDIVKSFGSVTIKQLFSSNAGLVGDWCTVNVLIRTNFYRQATSMVIVGVHTGLYRRRRPRRVGVSISGITAVTWHLPTVIVNKIATSQRQSAVGVQHAEKKKRKEMQRAIF